MRERPLAAADMELIEAAEEIVRKRFVPRWNSVGAALRTRTGKVYTAVHLDAAVGRVAVCAEMIALGMAVAAGDSEVDTIVAVTRRDEDQWEILPPCGMCRELLSDYAPDAYAIVPVAGDPTLFAISDLLPVKREAADVYPPRQRSTGRD